MNKNSVFLFSTSPKIRFIPESIDWPKAHLNNKIRAIFVPFLRSYKKRLNFNKLKKQIKVKNINELADITSVVRPSPLEK